MSVAARARPVNLTWTPRKLYTHEFQPQHRCTNRTHGWEFYVRRLFPFSLGLLFIPLFALFAQTAAPPQQLTIEAIFAEGGLTGRAPETIKWSPDGTKVSFVQRDDSGDHGELWYVDTATGEKKILVTEIKLAQLSPPLSKIKD